MNYIFLILVVIFTLTSNGVQLYTNQILIDSNVKLSKRVACLEQGRVYVGSDFCFATSTRLSN